MHTYLTIIHDCDPALVLFEERDGKYFFPRIQCQEPPMNGERMSSRCQKELKEKVGSSFDLAFLYSTINETYYRNLLPTFIATFESRESVKPRNASYKWLDADKVDIFELGELLDQFSLRYALRIFKECSERGVRVWEKPGWLRKTSEAATTTLSRLGYEVISPFEQLRVTPNSSILTVQTNQGKVYLKASTRKEAKITECISRVEPRLTPKPLYVDAENEWMLMRDYGSSMDGDLSLQEFNELKEYLARIQRKVESQIQQLQDGGVPVADPEQLESMIKNILETLLESGAHKDCVRIQNDVKEIEKFDENTVQKFCRHVRAFFRHLYVGQEIPLTIDHADLNAVNVIKSDDAQEGYLLIDWEHACIDLPFLTVDCLESEVVSEEAEKASADSYLQHWAEFGSLEKLNHLRTCMWLKSSLIRLIKRFEHADFHKFRPYFTEDEFNTLCDTLYDIGDIVEKLEGEK